MNWTRLFSTFRLCKRKGDKRSDAEWTLKQVRSHASVISGSSDCQVLQFAKINAQMSIEGKGKTLFTHINFFSFKEEDLG